MKILLSLLIIPFLLPAHSFVYVAEKPILEEVQEKSAVHEITAYCDKGIMASGLEVYDGAIACPRNIPLKTKIEILNKTYTCEDRLNKRFPYRYDIWMEDCSDAIIWGKQELSITTETFKRTINQ